MADNHSSPVIKSACDMLGHGQLGTAALEWFSAAVHSMQSVRATQVQVYRVLVLQVCVIDSMSMLCGKAKVWDTCQLHGCV